MPRKEDWVLTFSEENKGWVSFKSFTQMQLGISMANNYYTFFQGELYRHYNENVDRNTFYGGFTNSSLDVILNDNPGLVKVFNTLNYEGSQSKVDRFIDTIDGTLDLDFQPLTTYSDQEYYNLVSKNGWSVEEVITDLEEGNIQEFLEKEGKWFNNINRKIDITLDASDSGDFTFQGLGILGDPTAPNGGDGDNGGTTGSAGFGCTDPAALNYDPTALFSTPPGGNTNSLCNYGNGGPPTWSCGGGSSDLCYEVFDGSGLYTDQATCLVACASPSLWRCYDGNCYSCNQFCQDNNPGMIFYSTMMECACICNGVSGCLDMSANNYDPNATCDDGSCTYNSGCTDTNALNYDYYAVIDDGSCIY